MWKESEEQKLNQWMGSDEKTGDDDESDASIDLTLSCPISPFNISNFIYLGISW